MVEVAMFLVLLLLFPASLFSSTELKSLTEEFVQVNTQVQENTYNEKKAFLQIATIKAQKDWLLSGGVSRDDNKLVFTNPFIPTGSITDIYNLSLTKPLPWGGKLSFDNQLYKYDLTRVNPLLRSGIPNTTNELQSALSYTQDLGANFLGRKYQKDLQLAELNASKAALSNQELQQSLLYQFFSSFIQARLQKSLLTLQNKALQRAQKRKRLIRSYVRDGLRETVELHQAKILELTTQEEIKSTNQLYHSYHSELGVKLNRKLTEEEVPAYSLEKEVFDTLPEFTQQQNRTLNFLKKNQEFLENTLAKIKYDFFPKVTFKGEYRSNAIDTSTGSVYEEAFPVGTNRELTLSLNFSLPLGSRSAKNQKAQAKLDQLSNKLKLENFQKELELTEQSLKQRIKLLAENILSARKKRKLALRALSEQNKLYRLGKSGFESVLRSEEDLINTEKTLIQYLSQRQLLVGTYASLSGALFNFMTQGKVQ